VVAGLPSRSWCAGQPHHDHRRGHRRGHRGRLIATIAADERKSRPVWPAFERRDNATATTFDWRFTARSFVRAVRLAAGRPTFRMDSRVQGVHSEHGPNGRIM